MGRAVQIPYPMQLGSGTWDLTPGITILGMSERTSWGIQRKGTFRLGENSRGYRRGNGTEATAWNLNGPQLETDWVLTIGWQKSFAPLGHH